jgi:ketosteroid isomerase-like protein
VDPKEETLRHVFQARRRGDFGQVRRLLADDLVWHEPGEADYSGDHSGAETVVALMQRLADITGGTFVLEPQEVLVTDEFVAARTRWWAERAGIRVEGNELGIFRFAGGKIAEAWFWYDGYDEAAHRAVFAFD